MNDLYFEDQAQFYKERIAQREQLEKAVRLEDMRRWAESPNLETPNMKVKKVKSSWSLVSFIKGLRV